MRTRKCQLSVAQQGDAERMIDFMELVVFASVLIPILMLILWVEQRQRVKATVDFLLMPFARLRRQGGDCPMLGKVRYLFASLLMVAPLFILGFHVFLCCHSDTLPNPLLFDAEWSYWGGTTFRPTLLSDAIILGCMFAGCLLVLRERERVKR